MLRAGHARSRLTATALRPCLASPKNQVACIHASANPRSNWLTMLGLAVVSGGLGYSYATFFPSKLSLILAYPDAPSPLPIDSPEGIAAMAAVEKELQSLPVVQQFRAEREVTQSANAISLQGQSPLTLEQAPKWIESRPYQNYPEQKLRHHLTAGILRGPSKLAVKPLVFSNRDNSESYIIIHLGRSLCGHDGIIHGGLLATILDETLGRPALLNLPAKIGVTAYLHVNYKAPCFANQFVVVHTRLTKVDGRKAWSEADLSTLDGQLLVNANALFVQPKMASLLKNSSVKEAFGDATNSERL